MYTELTNVGSELREPQRGGVFAALLRNKNSQEKRSTPLSRESGPAWVLAEPLSRSLHQKASCGAPPPPGGKDTSCRFVWQLFPTGETESRPGCTPKTLYAVGLKDKILWSFSILPGLISLTRQMN